MLIPSTSVSVRAAFRSTAVFNPLQAVQTFLSDCALPATIEAMPDETFGVPIVWRNAKRRLCGCKMPVAVLADILGQIMDSDDRSESTVSQFATLAMMLSAFKLTRENRFIRDGLRVGRDNYVEWDNEARNEAANTALMGMLFPDLAYAMDSPCVMKGELTWNDIQGETPKGLIEYRREFTLHTNQRAIVWTMLLAENKGGIVEADRLVERCKGADQFVFHVKNGSVVGSTFRPIESVTAIAQMIGKGKRVAHAVTYERHNVNGVKTGVKSLNVDGLGEKLAAKQNRLFALDFNLQREAWECVQSGNLSPERFLILESYYAAEWDRLIEHKRADAYRIYRDAGGYWGHTKFYREVRKVVQWVQTQFIGEFSTKPGNVRTYRVCHE